MDGPYKDDSTNVIYHLLFCDRPTLFLTGESIKLTEPWKTLAKDPPDFNRLIALADDQAGESRVRALAFNKLLQKGQNVEPKQLLGTIIEVALPEGVDTLAAFADGNARYINHTGKMAIIEGAPGLFQSEIQAVMKASKPVVAVIGPWDKTRLPAPTIGNIRLTFLVSDGLYFGEGPMEVMQREPMAAPLIDAATELLVKLTQAMPTS